MKQIQFVEIDCSKDWTNYARGGDLEFLSCKDQSGWRYLKCFTQLRKQGLQQQQQLKRLFLVHGYIFFVFYLIHMYMYMKCYSLMPWGELCFLSFNLQFDNGLEMKEKILNNNNIIKWMVFQRDVLRDHRYYCMNGAHMECFRGMLLFSFSFYSFNFIALG